MEWWGWVMAVVILLAMGFAAGYAVSTKHLMSEINQGFIRIGGKTFSVTQKRGGHF